MPVKFFPLLLLVFISLFSNANSLSVKPRILVFTKTAGYHHSSIPSGIKAILKLGNENKFLVDTSSDASIFNETNLKKYAALVFLNTTGALLNNFQQADFERYMQAGGNFVGIHAASDAEYDWLWYGRLVGAYFDSHPSIQMADLHVTDKNHLSTHFLPDVWKRTDEWYNFKTISSDIHTLISIDERSYTGGTNGLNHPMAWYHTFEGGRSFYTELGHTDSSYSDPLYLKHLLGGIQFAIGENKPLDYTKCKTLRVPEESRFIKKSLVKGVFFEPTEMTILPNLDVLVVQRRGEIMLYKNDSKKVKQAGFIPAYFKTHVKGINAEEGILGLQADPDFKTNHFVYIYYSPIDTSVNRLSRFTLLNDSIDNKSEKIILQLYSQREICCHTGGSIAFGQNRTLYVSTGDNTTPFDEERSNKYNTHAFAPLDDRPGNQHYDSRRSAGNSNDLRGKILRITVKEDGSYSIPADNLFKPGQENTKPEIYVMGDRNPYRISVDKKNNYLYWGEVGPDANKDSLSTRGPRGYDELNQARTAGFFGWPLFIGPNIPYREYDYETGIAGKAFDAAHPVNNSRNNTGIKLLPPAQPAFIWYPYGDSKEFPQLGSGGRTAMAGPAYYTDLYPKETRLPEYYNKKVFFYEWIRGWIKVLTLQPNGDLDKMEPFMAGTKFNYPIDMETGPDGRIYILEYGTGWFTKNADAGLSRIDVVKASKVQNVLLSDKMINGKVGNGKIANGKSVNGKAINGKTGFKTANGKMLNGKTVSGKALPNKNKLAEQKTVSPGKTLMLTLDCRGCHKENELSVGPSFSAVSKKYPHNGTSENLLSQKIINGGSGVWGDVAMPAHPNLKPSETKQIINWIFSLK